MVRRLAEALQWPQKRTGPRAAGRVGARRWSSRRWCSSTCAAMVRTARRGLWRGRVPAPALSTCTPKRGPVARAWRERGAWQGVRPPNVHRLAARGVRVPPAPGRSDLHRARSRRRSRGPSTSRSSVRMFSASATRASCPRRGVEVPSSHGDTRSPRPPLLGGRGRAGSGQARPGQAADDRSRLMVAGDELFREVELVCRAGNPPHKS